MSVSSPETSAQSLTVSHVTADATLYQHNCPAYVTNLGATGTVELTLPQPRGGEVILAEVAVAQTLTLTAASGSALYFRGTKGSDAGSQSFSAIGTLVRLIGDDAGDWHISEYIPQIAPVAVDATGSAQGDAAALTANAANIVDAADGTKGVVLPAAVAGTTVRVYNLHATNGLPVYPASGDDINDGTTDAAVTIEGKTVATFEALDDTTWAATYTANT